jgi:hypothetical protein
MNVVDVESITLELLNSLRDEIGERSVELSVEPKAPGFLGTIVHFRPKNPRSAPLSVTATNGEECASAQVSIVDSWQKDWDIDSQDELREYRKELEEIARAVAAGNYEETIWWIGGNIIAADGTLRTAKGVQTSGVRSWSSIWKWMAERRSVTYEPYRSP